MADRALFRLRDMRQNIDEIDALLGGKTFEQMRQDTVVKAAFERFLEIVSEASRGVPDEWKLDQIADASWWRQLADLGNRIRHAYDKIDAQILWVAYEHDLPKLKRAVDAMLAARGQAV